MQKDKFEQLRQKAEALLSKQKPPQKGEKKEMLELLHELAVNQIELEVQNEELRETQVRLEEIMNNYFELYEFAPVGYFNMNERGVIDTVNLKAVKMFGAPRTKLLGRPLGGFIVPAFQDTFFTHLRGVLADTQSHSCELSILRPDHTQIFVQIESVHVKQLRKEEEGHAIRSAIIDITELHRTRQEIDGLNRGLETKVAERTAVADLRLTQLKTLNLELIRAEQRERRRLAELLHDNLQQILVGCQFNISFLRKSRDEKKKADMLGKTSTALKEAIDLSRSLSYDLCPPVLYQGGLPAAIEWLSVRKKTVYNLNVHLNVDPAFPRLPIDIETFLFQCARELLLNAIKHSKTKDADLTVRFSDGRLTLCVSDKGQGCPPGDIESSPHKKTGFGLFNIKNRIETMDGSFKVDSGNNQGFTVTLSLPVTCLSDPSQAAAEKPEIPVLKTPPVKVMLVEDHQVLREGICRLLETEEGILVIAEAEDGLQAIQKARIYNPDVILMDIGLPGMDGIEATAEITKENKVIRIIALTLHESQGMVKRMLNAGACLYLTKNVPAEELIQAIRDAAANAPVQKSDASG